MDAGFLISFAIAPQVIALRGPFRSTFRTELIPLILLSSARDRFYAPHADTTAAALEGDLVAVNSRRESSIYTPQGAMETREAAEASDTQPVRTPEFTLRAILVGSLIGALVMAANIYMGLKIGFIEGYAILSAILCFAIVRVFGGRLSILENTRWKKYTPSPLGIGIGMVVPARSSGS